MLWRPQPHFFFLQKLTFSKSPNFEVMSVKTKRATFMLHRPSDSKSRAPRPEPFIHLVMIRMMVLIRMRMRRMMEMMLMLLNIGYKTTVTIADGSQYDEKLCDDDDEYDEDWGWWWLIMLTLAGAHPLLQTNCCNFPLELWTPGSRPPSSPRSPAHLREYSFCCSW